MDYSPILQPLKEKRDSIRQLWHSIYHLLPATGYDYRYAVAIGYQSAIT